MRNFTQEYQYDEIGNLLQMKSNGVWTRDYKYNFATNNHLLKHDENATINSYEYDAHGNTTKMPHLPEMKYDYADQLNEVTLNLDGNKAYYIYNAEGERVRKIIEKGNIIEERFYLGDYEIYSKKTNGTLDVERETLHIVDDTKKIALIETKTGESAVIRYQHDNHLGSASLELDENAEIISYEEYHPFGTTSYRSGRSETETSLKRYKYVGKERDEETGLYYYGARYYSAWTCRFVSVDPLAHERQWLNPYNYVQNNPINKIDPDGALDDDHTIVVENDDGTYTVLGGDAYDGDNGIYLDDGKEGKGDLVGYSATPESFYFSETEKTQGDGTGQFLGTIDPNDNSGKSFLNNLIKENPSAIYYAPNAVGGKKYDFKTTNGTDEVLFSKNSDKYRGMPLLGDKNGKPIFASARDIGNIGAGLVAGRAGLGWTSARAFFDGLESYQRGSFSSESSSTQFGQKLGLRIGSQMYLKYQRSRLPGQGNFRNTTITKDIIERKDL